MAMIARKAVPPEIFGAYRPTPQTSLLLGTRSFNSDRVLRPYFSRIVTRTMAHPYPEIIYGTAAIASFPLDDLHEAVTCLQNHNITSLDTARVYVDVYYLHGPDPTTPIEETLSAIRELYTLGKFRRFGISNFRPSDVQRIYNIQAEAQSVLPTVYQGCYNALARHAETDLFPLLRDHGINFYAYSPIAGGFLAKRSSQLHEHNPEDVEGEKAVEGRFGAKNMHGEMYRALYCKPAMLDALDEWNTIAKDAGIGGSALAYRWVRFHSSLGRGDAVVIGARSVGQLRETLEVMDAGPLDEEVAERVEGLWEGVRGVAPRDNWDGFLKRKVVR
ncbi:MAG: hypothetical protein LQ350_006403 [Teloschistes chrysophthalmus]|nr:MAG: hypothetical protein LQ350_006403 [Niorma chrysophthalma]